MLTNGTPRIRQVNLEKELSAENDLNNHACRSLSKFVNKV